MPTTAASTPPWSPLARLAPPQLPQAGAFPPAPSDMRCFELWDQFDMLPHIREHSLSVAGVATHLALGAKAQGLRIDVQLVRASALLHDIAKTYTIRHGGNHSQLGGAWMQEILGNPALAMGIIHHVHWPWPVDARVHFLPMAIIYADKRVMHNRIVTLDERFEDLYARYGTTDYLRQRLAESLAQSREIENALSQTLGTPLHEDTFDSRGLVE